MITINGREHAPHASECSQQSRVIVQWLLWGHNCATVTRLAQAPDVNAKVQVVERVRGRHEGGRCRHDGGARPDASQATAWPTERLSVRKPWPIEADRANRVSVLSGFWRSYKWNPPVLLHYVQASLKTCLSGDSHLCAAARNRSAYWALGGGYRIQNSPTATR